MTVFVLDSSALIRYIDNEPGSARVVEILKDCVAARCEIRISAVQWGEVAGNVRKRAGASEEERILSRLPSEIEVVPATASDALRAAALKVDRHIAYADAFALGLALEFREHVLVTADYGFNAVADLANIEFLPAK
jgi:predicted nucleic acid-binding protein